MSIDLISQAEGFAKAAHYFPLKGNGPQTRKYTGDLYWTHCREVAYTVSQYTDRSVVIAAAWLHDVLEDTAITPQYLTKCLGEDITQLVLEVTDRSIQERFKGMNRASRKEIDLEHLANSSCNGATIKLADLIDNTKSIAKYDLDFARVYLAEKEALLQVLAHGNKQLWQLANKTLVEARNTL